VSKEVAVIITALAGGLVGAQAPVNSVVSDKMGSLGAVAVNFVVGTALILVIALVFAGGFEIDSGADSPAWYYWIFGGVAGVAIVLTTLVTVRHLGAGGVTAAVIAGQLTSSVVIDRLGLLGLEERAVGWDKLVGIALLAAGTVLIVRE
jgi:bacterial/archaeal transporter family-2 protein